MHERGGNERRPAPPVPSWTAASRFLRPLCLAALLQRVAFTVIRPEATYGSRIDASSLRKGEIIHPVSVKQPRETIVSFDAARLGVYSVFLVVLPNEFLLGRPGPGPHRRILDRYGIFERRRVG